MLRNPDNPNDLRAEATTRRILGRGHGLSHCQDSTDAGRKGEIPRIMAGGVAGSESPTTQRAMCPPNLGWRRAFDPATRRSMHTASPKTPQPWHRAELQPLTHSPIVKNDDQQSAVARSARRHGRHGRGTRRVRTAMCAGVPRLCRPCGRFTGRSILVPSTRPTLLSIPRWAEEPNRQPLHHRDSGGIVNDDPPHRDVLPDIGPPFLSIRELVPERSLDGVVIVA
jgi:hypothetical protein